MWKWTDADNIQAIILDMNSLSQEYLEHPFTSILKDVKVFKVKAFGNKDVKKTKEIIEYYDIPSLLQDILSIVKCYTDKLQLTHERPQFVNLFIIHILGI